MEVPASSVSEEPPRWPAGVERVRLSERPDLSGALYAAWNEAFAGHWGSEVESEAEFWEERRDAKRGSAFPFEPALWLLALDHGEVVGFCLCELNTSDGTCVGRVAEIGVVPARRGAGLGLALLQDGFQELRRSGATRIVLDVDAENQTSALRLYERAGMTPRPAFTIWEK
jgi:mycothiol synthase